MKKASIFLAALGLCATVYAQPSRCIFKVQFSYANSTQPGICQNAIDVLPGGSSQLLNAWRTLKYAYVPRTGCSDLPGDDTCAHTGEVVACGLVQSELTDSGYVFTLRGAQGTITEQDEIGDGACDGLFGDLLSSPS